MTSQRVDRELQVQVERGILVIRLGVETLAKAVEFNPALQNRLGEGPTVANAAGLARDVVTQLLAEEEDGTTLVHRMIDKAVDNAIEQGTENVELPREVSA